MSDGTPNPVLWPIAPYGDGQAPSGDGQGTRQDAFAAGHDIPSIRPNLGQLPPHSGDGHARSLHSMQPTRPPVGSTPPRSVRTPKAEAMKLALLVVFFLLWISTASTLLFLYMDRYLFPG